jgi:glycerophosphoryl diester phosphodiesterase
VRPGYLAGALLCALVLQVAGSGAAQRATGTLLAAHRGGAALWPENSLLAFRNAVALGVDYLELDVHLSRDGHVVVIHDPTLDRTTTGRGAVRDATLEDLRAVRLRGPDGAATAETVPTLDEVAALAADTGRQVLVEIKVDRGRARYPGIEERVLAVLDRHRLAAAAVVMAFEPETWRRVRAIRPDVAAGALYSARALPPGAAVAGALDDARAAGVAFVGLQHPLVTADVADRARRSGILLGAWTVNEADAMRRVVDAGVGVLITDRPDTGRELLNQRRSP